jgi:hypothetical protein
MYRLFPEIKIETDPLPLFRWSLCHLGSVPHSGCMSSQAYEAPSTHMITTLRELHRLLVKHDYPGQAETVAKLIELREGDGKDFTRLLQSGEMWGGSGAVWEVGSMEGDTRAFRSAIMSLAAEMDEAGLGLEHSNFIANVFRDWNEKGL